MEAVTDWFLVFRTPQDLAKMGAKLPGAKVEVLTDQTRLMHLLVAEKV